MMNHAPRVSCLKYSAIGTGLCSLLYGCLLAAGAIIDWIAIKKFGNSANKNEFFKSFLNVPIPTHHQSNVMIANAFVQLAIFMFVGATIGYLTARYVQRALNAAYPSLLH